MEIIIVRHAKSAHDYTRWPTDSVRPLSDIGIRRQNECSKGMYSKNISFNTIWVSPFTRALQTLEIIQNNYQTDITPIIKNSLEVWGEPSDVRQEIQDWYSISPTDKLLIVGHNPNLSDLVYLLTKHNLYLKTSEVVQITYNGEYFLFKNHLTRSQLYLD